MAKTLEMGKTSAIGSLHLFIGKIISTVVLAIGTIVVGIFIAQDAYGAYTIALVPSTTFILFLDWGVGTALTKYCASYRAAKKEEELRSIILTALVFLSVSGLILTLISLSTANFVASTIFNTPESAFLVGIASITIFSTALLIGANSVFMGFERMKLATITLTVSALANGLFSPLLVYLGYGAFGVMIGHTVGSVASGITAVALLYFSIIRKLPLVSHAKRNIVQNLKPLLRYGIPLSVGSIIAGISPQINSFVMASYVKLSFIGNYRIAANFAVLLDFFIYPIQTVLFPAFSKIDASTDKTRLKNVFSTSVKYSSLFITPATMALIVLSTPIIGTIYATKWPFAPIYLSLHALGYLTVLLGNLNYTQLLYATGETKFILKLNAFKLCLGVPMAFLLIPPFGIIGLISQSLFVGVPTMIGGLYWTWKRYGVKADMHNSGRILLASTIASALTYLFLSFFVADTWIMLLSGFLLFLAVYLISAPLIGAINQADISNFRVMFSGLGPISKILKAILAILEKPLRVKDKISKNRLQ